MIIWVYKQISWDLNMGQNLKNHQIRRFWWFCEIFKYVNHKTLPWLDGIAILGAQAASNCVARGHQVQARVFDDGRTIRGVWADGIYNRNGGENNVLWTKTRKNGVYPWYSWNFRHIWNNLDEFHGCRNEIPWDHHYRAIGVFNRSNLQ